MNLKLSSACVLLVRLSVYRQYMSLLSSTASSSRTTWPLVNRNLNYAVANLVLCSRWLNAPVSIMMKKKSYVSQNGLDGHTHVHGEYFTTSRYSSSSLVARKVLITWLLLLFKFLLLWFLLLRIIWVLTIEPSLSVNSLSSTTADIHGTTWSSL
jgi:hypothetical protein